MRTVKSLFMLTLILLVSFSAVFAQVTTSSMTGTVTDGNETLPGATVIAVHTPSGTQYASITNEVGRYFIQGMRPGGPYKVTIQFVGMKAQDFDNVYLSLGETYKLNATLGEDVNELQEVVVEAKNKFDANKTGASSRISAEDLENMPSISHSIADAARLNPQIATSNNGAMSFAGVNNRYNSFQVDGAMNNDVFGLTSNGSNGGQAGTQPISLESLDQIQVSIAPFDVRQSGFTGGSINAITKSGTNVLHGSVYADGLNQSLIGSRYEMMNGKNSEKYEDEMEYRAGFTLGGAIVKNKLFFFANYEHTDKEYPNNYGVGAAASKADPVEAQKILSTLQDLGYKGDLSNPDSYVKSDKAGLKLDWNINTKHKAAISWRMVNAKQVSGKSSANYLDAYDYAYDFISKTNTFTAELQSRFSDKISNEFKTSYVRVRDHREPYGISPYIEIKDVGKGSAAFGTERSSGANALNQDIFTITDNLTWYAGCHTVTFGTHNEFYKFENLFIQDYYGSYYFTSPQNFYDFANGKTISSSTDDEGNVTYFNTLNQYRYGMANAAVTGDKRWAPKFGAAELGFYVQDKWTVSDRFDLTYGLRMDVPLFFDTPEENADFNAYAEQNGWNVKTNQKLSSSPLWSPRVGFRYELDGKGDYVLRGGAGIFTGRIPFVWLSNNFSNTGIQLTTYNVYGGSDLTEDGFVIKTNNDKTRTVTKTPGNLNDAKLIINPDGQAEMYETLNASGSQVVNVFADDFKFAQSLKFNLAFDFTLGGVDFTAEWLLSKVLNDVVYKDLTRDLTGKTVNDKLGLDFDDRPTLEKPQYDGNYYKTLNNCYLLDNTNKGYSTSVSFKGSKKFNFGLGLSASYTFTRSKSVNSATSSVAESNYRYNYTYQNPNDPELGFSAYNTPHRITAAVTYSKSYAEHWTSTVSLIYTGTSGQAYSVYYSGDLNGDGQNGNDLMFIPTDEQIDKMSFLSTYDEKTKKGYTEEQQRANLKAWLASEDYLKDHRGEYFERYAANEKFENHFDFHFAQRFNFKVGNQTHGIELSFDVMNISNMFSAKWGRYSGTSGYYSPVKYDKSGKYQFLQKGDYQMRSYADYYSRWRGQIGLKYIF
ncbi:MAG: TonB-dependent receptor [Bacteroidales bacterium]|nr:TonB-dependent receptor [Bacteroidales bacterium]